MEIKSELMDRRLFSRNLRIVSSTKNYSPQLKKPQNVEAEKKFCELFTREIIQNTRDGSSDGRTELETKESELITINPFPGARGDAGLFLRTHPDELRLQIAFPPVQLCQYVVLCGPAEIMQQITAWGGIMSH